MFINNENLTPVCETLYNSFENEGEVATNLHIFAIKTTEEFWRLTELIENRKGDEICDELKFHSDIIPIESCPGKTFTKYSPHIIGDFLIIEEIYMRDV